MAYMNLSYTHIISYTQYAVHSIIMYTMLKYKLLCPRGTQTCVLAMANIAHAV